MLFVEVDGNSEETVVTTVTCQLFPTPTGDYPTFDSVTVTLLNDEPSYLGYKWQGEISQERKGHFHNQIRQGAQLS